MRNTMTAVLLSLALALGGAPAWAQEEALTDTDMALGYYQPLAEQGEPYAQLTIGEIYMEGAGVPQDLVQAYAWFAASYSQGVQEAKMIMDHVYGKLPPARQGEARALAEQFIQAYGRGG